ncbi:MAG: chromate resistance protein ChrB domain-containing protein [Candidatus Odinarchaeota archaeon]
MIWVTREFVHVDRVACPWLIKRFIDKKAQFVFLPPEEISDFVSKTGATPFDTGAKIGLEHHVCDSEIHCSFDAIVEQYQLEGNEALQCLRKIVRAADTNRINEEPLAWALETIALGMPLLVESDHEVLEKEFPLYDALYTYFQREIIREKFKNEFNQLQTRAEKQIFLRQKIKGLSRSRGEFNEMSHSR